MTKSERELLDSPFLDAVRGLRFDETEYARLVGILKTLSEELAPAQTVDKHVAAELLIIPPVLRGAATRLSGDQAERTQDAADELETLAPRCLLPA